MLFITVHGLGGTHHSHVLIRYYLENYVEGKNEIITYSYNSKSVSFTDVVTDLQKYLDTYTWTDEQNECILIGHSLGGLICSNVTHPRIKGVITISSPHNGCALAQYVKSYVSDFVSTFLFGEMYQVLTDKPNPCPSKLVCITSSWSPWYKFDGRVYTDEMTHPNAIATLHLEYSDHIIQLYDYRMMNLILDAIKLLNN